MTALVTPQYLDGSRPDYKMEFTRAVHGHQAGMGEKGLLVFVETSSFESLEKMIPVPQLFSLVGFRVAGETVMNYG